MQEQLLKTKALYDEQETRLGQLRSVVAPLEDEVKELVVREQRLRQRTGEIQWLRDNKPVHDLLTSRYTALTVDITTLTKVLAEQSAVVETLASEREREDAQLTETSERIQSNQIKLVTLKDVDTRYASWRHQTARRSTVDAARVAADAAVGRLQAQLDASSKELTSARLEEQTIAGGLVRIERAQSELQNLLAALEMHVTGPHCPACGALHRSREQVIQLLREARNSSAASNEARSQLQQVRERVTSLRTRYQQLADDMTAAESRSAAAATELTGLNGDTEQFEERIRELDFDLLKLADQLQERRTEAERTLNELHEAHRLQQRRADDARMRLAKARVMGESLSRELEMKKKTQEDISGQIDQLRRESVLKHANLDVKGEEILRVETETRRFMDELTATVAPKRAALESSRQTLAESERSGKNLKQELERFVNAARPIEHAVRTYEGDLGALEIPVQGARTELASRADDATGRVRLLGELNESTKGLEMAIDASVTAAAAAKLTDNIRFAENTLADLRKEQTQYEPWVAYFNRIKQRLEETQNWAVERYTDEYGPLASTIQRRLRAVSGFEDISLHPDGSSIDVRVNRGIEQLPPTDFFSQSQQQILILSLFFTACITQTWSAFAPILLDDPVSNFDDLNGYALLDLIGGFLEDRRSERQFILSICDERLFELARQRFQHLGDRSRIYRFTSLGRDGPVIESL